jgi:hypothetical protein
MINSSREQAEVAANAGREVICVDEAELIYDLKS